MRSVKLITVLLLWVIVFLSCDDQKVAITKESPLSPNPYGYLGKIHNDGLEILKNMNNKSTRIGDVITSDMERRLSQLI